MNYENNEDNPEGLSRYKIHSRREIANLLRSVGRRNQLVRVQGDADADSVVTSVLHVDDTDGIVVIDCAPSRITNKRLLESSEVSFETVLDNIRIRFSSSGIDSCTYEDRPAFSIPIPASLIRLQRREFYRVLTLVTTPVKCTLPVLDENGRVQSTVTLPLSNVSAGGIGVVDDKKRINPDFSAVLANCRLDLPGGPVTVTLRLRNSQDITLRNGKNVRKLGFMFVNPSNAVDAAIQRYITKLEREQNARKAGFG
jgi:c-di-GMP-binding flagellar brake protein YcgR